MFYGRVSAVTLWLLSVTLFLRFYVWVYFLSLLRQLFAFSSLGFILHLHRVCKYKFARRIHTHCKLLILSWSLSICALLLYYALFRLWTNRIILAHQILFHVLAHTKKQKYKSGYTYWKSNHTQDNNNNHVVATGGHLVLVLFIFNDFLLPIKHSNWVIVVAWCWHAWVFENALRTFVVGCHVLTCKLNSKSEIAVKVLARCYKQEEKVWIVGIHERLTGSQLCSNEYRRAQTLTLK